MSWPTKIELHKRQENPTYSGTQVINTWRVFPYDAAPAFQSAMLGHVEDDGTRVFPANDYKYDFCYATGCVVNEFDPRQFSSMGSTDYDNGQSLDSIVRAVTNYDPAGKTGLVADADIDLLYTDDAGCLVSVTYEPLISLLTGGFVDEDMKFNYINWELTPRLRTNVINAGLRLITPTKGFYGWYPAAQVAPVVNEEFQHLTVQRRMLPFNFDVSKLSAYINCVNNRPIYGGPNAFGNGAVVQFPKECLKFVSFESSYVYVPKVDNDGEPKGFWRWMDVQLHFDWRTLQHPLVFDENGNGPALRNVTWNHLLAYPGEVTEIIDWLANKIAGVGEKTKISLAWYVGKFAANLNKGMINFENGQQPDDLQPAYPLQTIDDVFEF